MEQQYKTDAEIYAVLEREIIDLTCGRAVR